MGRSQVRGVVSIFFADRILQTPPLPLPLKGGEGLRTIYEIKYTDPTPAPASPHRRFAPQLLRPPSLRSPIAPSSRLPRNCLEGRGKATAGEEFPG